MAQPPVRAFAQRPEGDAYAVGGLGILDARLHGGFMLPASLKADKADR